MHFGGLSVRKMHLVSTDVARCYAVQMIKLEYTVLQKRLVTERRNNSLLHSLAFLPRDAMHSAIYAVLQCLSVCESFRLSVCPPVCLVRVLYRKEQTCYQLFFAIW